MKKILILSICISLILIRGYAQSINRPGAKTNNLRTAANPVPKPAKSYTYNGTDSTNLEYSYTSFYQYDSRGNEIKRVDIDTLRNDYKISYITTFDDLNRLASYTEVDTASKDTNSNSFIASYPIKGLQVVTYKDYKKISVDSAGLLIIDSSFYRENNVWKFQQVQRDYYSTNGRKIIGLITTISTPTMPAKALWRNLNYTYKDTLLLSYDRESFNETSNQWSKNGSLKITYTDENGSSLTQDFDTSGILNYFYEFKYDESGDLIKYYSPNTSIVNKFTSTHSMKQYDIHQTDTIAKTSRHMRVVYEDFKTYGVSAVEITLLKEGSLLLFPNPTNSTLHIGLLDKSIEIKKIEIRNILGQIVYASQQLEELSIHLDHVNEGIYQVEITTNHGSVYKTILKN